MQLSDEKLGVLLFSELDTLDTNVSKIHDRSIVELRYRYIIIIIVVIVDIVIGATSISAGALCEASEVAPARATPDTSGAATAGMVAATATSAAALGATASSGEPL